MAVDEKWYFTKEQLLQSPSRKSGYDVDKELSCRQQAANFIQDMGQRLQVSQLCINTAIVYMQRFYVFHSFAAFHRNGIAAAALFLAAKVEEQPRKLEHVIKVSHMCLHRENPNLDTKSELYLEQAQDLVFNENVLLQTLGFDVAIDHPHTYVVKCCQLVRASKDLAQTSYFMASNSLHLTTMCLQYKPTVVACFCIHLACRWSNWEIPRSNEGRDWFWYIDKTVTIDLLEQLTAEFIAVLDKCPTKLKRKMMSMNQNNAPGFTQQHIPHDGLQFEEPRKLPSGEGMKPPEGLFPVQKSSSQTSNDKPGTSNPVTVPTIHAHHQKIDYREYREKKERERMERQQQLQQRDAHNVSSGSHHHHSKSNVMPSKPHTIIQSRSSSSSISHKSYQQPPQGMQQNIHFQNVKESRDSISTKDSNYLKQHPPHTERDVNKDNTAFHGQYSQNSNSHQSFSHKSENNYLGNYLHREGSRGNHNVQSSGNSNPSQIHNSRNQNAIGSNSNSNQKEYLMENQRDTISVKDSESQSQSQGKDAMSSSIRDIINQSVSQRDIHSITNDRKEHMRDKSRVNFVHNTSSNIKHEAVKSGRDQLINFHESTDRKMDDFASKLKEKPIKKELEESVIDTVKMEPIHIKQEKFDETDIGDESSTWNSSNVRNEKITAPAIIKSELNSNKNEANMDSSRVDFYASNPDSGKLQSGHSMKMFDSKYKSHHYHTTSKNSEVQIKNEKPSAQCSSDFLKKLNERNLDKPRKTQELERIPITTEGSSNLGDISKHHKFNKEMNDKNQMAVTGQHNDQRIKEKMSPSKFQRVKTVPRPPGLNYLKSDSGHFSLDANPISNVDSEKIEVTNHSFTSNRSLGIDEINISSFSKQKSHEFGAPGNLSNILQDSNSMKTNKTSSIFSPDSKIPPQNILSSLEKESKKSSSVSHRSNHSSSKTSPNSTANSKKTVTSSVGGTLTLSTTSTTGSLFSPPLPKNISSVPPRQRTSSSGSEPELMLIVKKLEETPGYENIIREKKIALTPTNETSGNFEKEKEKKLVAATDKFKGSNQHLFGFDIKTSAKDNKFSDNKSNLVKSDIIASPNTSKTMVNVKFPNEIRSDLGAVIYPTNPKSAASSKSSQGFSLSETKHSFNNSISTVNLLGVEKMVDTSISPAKQSNQFNTATVKTNIGSNVGFNSIDPATIHKFGSSPVIPAADQSDKVIVDQNVYKNSVISSQEIDVDGIGYVDKKKSEKKKKKEKHKHKEKDKDKDKSERKKEKKKHKEKDRERFKEKTKEKEKHKEKEIDVVSSEIPIKITIPKDKISGSLKFKISKDCLKKEEADSLKSNASGELKIKISKDVISSIGTYKDESKGDSKKRDRSPKSTSDLPYPKSMKTSEKKSSSSSLKPNGTEGPSRNSSSLRYSVSENGSCFDISGLYDFPFDFEESGQGIIKTPDYDFEAVVASEFRQDINTSFEIKEIEECDKNSHNELELMKDEVEYVATKQPNEKATTPNSSDSCSAMVSCGDISSLSASKNNFSLTDSCSLDCSVFKDENPNIKQNFSVHSPSPDNSFSDGLLFKNKTEIFEQKINAKHDSLSENDSYRKRDEILNYSKNQNTKKDQIFSLENCDILKNYKTILDSHSRRCETDLIKHRVSPISPEDTATSILSNNDDNNNTNNLNDNESAISSLKISTKSNKNNFDTENPNYYNKYFKKNGGTRTFTAEYKRTLKGRQDEKSKFDDRQKFYESRRFRNDFNEKDRIRQDRRIYREYRDYTKDSSQYYYDRKDDRRFDYTDYSSNQFFNSSKTDNNAQNLKYDININGIQEMYQNPTSSFPQLCDPAVSSNPDMNVQYQYGYFNNFVYPNNYRFYGNMPFVNMSLIQQQPIPPGTGDNVPIMEPPPLPLEPPPDLPPPPETPPPPPN